MLNALEYAQIPESDESFRTEVRSFLKDALADFPYHRQARSWVGADPAFSQKLADKGWLGLTLPKEYGGSGKGFFARFVFSEELLNAGAPVASHWIADRQSGPLISCYRQ